MIDTWIRVPKGCCLITSSNSGVSVSLFSTSETTTFSSCNVSGGSALMSFGMNLAMVVLFSTLTFTKTLIFTDSDNSPNSSSESDSICSSCKPGKDSSGISCRISTAVASSSSAPSVAISSSSSRSSGFSPVFGPKSIKGVKFTVTNRKAYLGGLNLTRTIPSLRTLILTRQPLGKIIL